MKVKIKDCGYIGYGLKFYHLPEWRVKNVVDLPQTKNRHVYYVEQTDEYYFNYNGVWRYFDKQKVLEFLENEVANNEH